MLTRMWNKSEIDEFWENRNQGSGDPCHYMNKWQDEYAWEARSAALHRLSRYFVPAKLLVDIGCGIGRYTKLMASMGNGQAIGFDRFEFVQRARETSTVLPVDFRTATIPDVDVEREIKEADVVTLLTVYNFMPHEDREALFGYLRKCKPGAVVMVLEWTQELVPGFQKGLGYKDIESESKLKFNFFQAGFDIDEIEVVNRIDGAVFRLLGKNVLAYWLTKLGEKLLWFLKPRYRVFVFRKLN